MRILQPIKIGELVIRNRIVMTATHLGYCPDGFATERLINFYRPRAEGGAGLIVVGCCSIDEHRAYTDMLDLSKDDFIESHRRLTETIKDQGASVCLQLMHPGRYASSRITGITPIAPSPLSSALSRERPREMTFEDIRKAVSSFAAAARRAVEAGYEMVEINASAGYLISQFFSPLANHRLDEYGGSLENRARFGIEVVRAVKEAVKNRIMIMVRLSGNDFMPGGNTNQEMQYFAKLLEEAGAQAFNVTGGWHESRVPQITMDVPPGAYVYLAQGIKKAVNVPVIACNRINDPLLAEKILYEGRADMVGMARALIADPNLPDKVVKGQFVDIRKCIGCNQGCLDAIFRDKSCECLVNARVGRERETEIIPTSKSKRVLVIGGGAAGMEAARVASMRGHKVTLWEKNSCLGGQLLLAAAVPGREDFYHLSSFLQNSLHRLGVKVVLDKEATTNEICNFAPDCIVVATGAEPLIPNIAGIGLSTVVSAWDVLRDKKDLGAKVIVIGGNAVGCETALYIARMGTIDALTFNFLMLNEAEGIEKIKRLAVQGTKDVTVLEMEEKAGKDLGVSTRWPILQELRRYGVKIMTSTKAIEIESDGVVVEHNGQIAKIYADSIVVAVGSVSENKLYEQLKAKFFQVFLIGDAKEPRKAIDAVKEGFYTGYRI